MSLSATHIRNAAIQHILAGGSPLPSQPVAPSPPVLPPLATSTGWPAATRAAYTSHNAQITDDARKPPEPAPACSNEVHYSLDDDAWLAGAFTNRSDAQVRIDHLRNLLDVEELRLDELEDAIRKHHLMVQSRHHRDGLLHRLSSYIDPPRSSARPGRDAQSTRPDIRHSKRRLDRYSIVKFGSSKQHLKHIPIFIEIYRLPMLLYRSLPIPPCPTIIL